MVPVTVLIHIFTLVSFAMIWIWPHIYAITHVQSVHKRWEPNLQNKFLCIELSKTVPVNSCPKLFSFLTLYLQKNLRSSSLKIDIIVKFCIQLYHTITHNTSKFQNETVIRIQKIHKTKFLVFYAGRLKRAIILHK